MYEGNLPSSLEYVILQWLYGPEKFPGLSRNGPLESERELGTSIRAEQEGELVEVTDHDEGQNHKKLSMLDIALMSKSERSIV